MERQTDEDRSCIASRYILNKRDLRYSLCSRTDDLGQRWRSTLKVDGVQGMKRQDVALLSMPLFNSTIALLQIFVPHEHDSFNSLCRKHLSAVQRESRLCRMIGCEALVRASAVRNVKKRSTTRCLEIPNETTLHARQMAQLTFLCVVDECLSVRGVYLTIRLVDEKVSLAKKDHLKISYWPQ